MAPGGGGGGGGEALLGGAGTIRACIDIGRGRFVSGTD